MRRKGELRSALPARSAPSLILAAFEKRFGHETDGVKPFRPSGARSVERPSDVILVEQHRKKDSTWGKQARGAHDRLADEGRRLPPCATHRRVAAPATRSTGRSVRSEQRHTYILERDDMVDFMRKERHVRREQTILTALVGALADQPAKAGRDGTLGHGMLVRCDRLPALSNTSTCSIRSNSSSSACSAGMSCPARPAGASSADRRARRRAQDAHAVRICDGGGR